MSLEDKTFAQKAVEKTLMLERHDSFGLILAKNPSGPPSLVVGVVKEGGTIVPLAKLLSKREIDSMDPLFDSREWWDEVMSKARTDIPWSAPDDFLKIGQLDYLSRDEVPFD
jgi:hypothetical protein